MSGADGTHKNLITATKRSPQHQLGGTSWGRWETGVPNGTQKGAPTGAPDKESSPSFGDSRNDKQLQTQVKTPIAELLDKPHQGLTVRYV